MSLRPAAALVCLVGALWAAAPAAFAGPGDLDRGFGANGIARITQARGYGVATQSNGKIVAVGDQGGQLTVFRLNLDGSLDPSFGGDGSVSVTFSTGGSTGREVAIQRDGKILVGGIWAGTGGGIARLNPDGSLDQGFGGGGKGVLGNAQINAVALKPDDNAVLGGTGPENEFTVSQLTGNGFFDAAFGGDGSVFLDVSGPDRESRIDDIAVRRDGDVVAIGSSSGYVDRGDTSVFTNDTVVARLGAGGSPDGSFGAGGLVRFSGTGAGAQLALQPDGALLVSNPVPVSADPANTGSDAIVRRLLSNGKGDLSFNEGQAIRFDFRTQDMAPELALQENGKIVTAGVSADALQVGRLQPGGAADTTFGSNGRTSVALGAVGFLQIGGVALQLDGAIVVVGTVNSDLVVARLQGDPTGLDALGRGTGGEGDSGGGPGGGGGGRPPRCVGKRATIVGTPGKDKLRGTRRADVIVGLGGNDSISGVGGNDVVCGSDGKDRIAGGDGTDRLDGGNGNDSLDGGAGNDSETGGAGNDSVKGGAGNDRVLGGSGKDKLAGGAGRDTLLGGAGTDKLAGGAGKDKEKQ